MADCPQNKSNSPSGEKEEEIANKVSDSGKNNQQEHKKKKSRVKFANLTVEETLGRDFDDCSSSMLTLILRNRTESKVSKGHFVFDTGADVYALMHQCLSQAIHLNKPRSLVLKQAEVGLLSCLGRFLFMSNCPVGLISSHI